MQKKKKLKNNKINYNLKIINGIDFIFLFFLKRKSRNIN